MNMWRPAGYALLLMCANAEAAIALDRTRVIFPGDSRAVALSLRNTDLTQPYLVQTWLDDLQGNTVHSPFALLPPLQRIEPGTDTLAKIQALPAVSVLPQDRESLYYFNVRAIPPRTTHPNRLQLSLQTRIKFIYRPAALLVPSGQSGAPWARQLTVKRQGAHYVLINPTPYYLAITSASAGLERPALATFDALTLAPREQVTLKVGPAQLGQAPVFTYLDDYGEQRTLAYRCDLTCALLPDVPA